MSCYGRPAMAAEINVLEHNWNCSKLTLPPEVLILLFLLAIVPLRAIVIVLILKWLLISLVNGPGDF